MQASNPSTIDDQPPEAPAQASRPPTPPEEPPLEPTPASAERTRCPSDWPSPHTPDSTDSTHYFHPKLRKAQSFLNNDSIRFTSHASGPATSRYRVLTTLGAGGYATVWLAVDQAPPLPWTAPKYVAIKIQRRPAENNEEKCLRKLRTDGDRRWGTGQNIIQLYDAFDADTSKGKCRCLAMELGGESLEGMGRCTLDVAVAIFRQCVEAVRHVHARGFACGGMLPVFFPPPDTPSLRSPRPD